MKNKMNMARRNNTTNTLIKWTVIAGDFVLLNSIICLFRLWHPYLMTWAAERAEVLWVVCNLAMAVAMWKFSTIIHLRMISGGDILRRVIELVMTQTVIAYLIMKAIDVNQPVGWQLMGIGVCQIVAMIIVRMAERSVIKRIRKSGRNTRTVTFVGNDAELDNLYKRLILNPTLGYRFTGYYGNENRNENEKGNTVIDRLSFLGTIDKLMTAIKDGELIDLGDEVYICLPMREREKLMTLSTYCDSHVVRFYYVPISVEKLGLSMKRELLDDVEVFTTHEIPLENPTNKVAKRLFDIIVSSSAFLALSSV